MLLSKVVARSCEIFFEDSVPKWNMVKKLVFEGQKWNGSKIRNGVNVRWRSPILSLPLL